MIKKYLTGICSAALFMILILDSKTALTGAGDGISLCLKVVIPSLFPFFVLSSIITGSISGSKTRILMPISRFCGIPQGSEIFLLMGFLGGYPVGAKSVCEAYRKKQLSRHDAQRMLCFSNNPGPAFIFGMVATLFDLAIIPWLLWGINIASAIITGFILPGKSTSSCCVSEKSSVSVTGALLVSVRAIANICGWVIIFRIIISICQHWLLWLLPLQIQIAICGILELSNGCYFLLDIPSQALRFIFCSGFLTFGGLCVTMQTASELTDLSLSSYLIGKIVQTTISICLSILLLPILFGVNFSITMLLCLVFSAAFTYLFILRKKEWKSHSKCSTI